MYQVNTVNINGQAEGERLYSAIGQAKKPEIRQKLMRLQGEQEMPFLEQIRSMYGESEEISRTSTQTFEDTDKRRHVLVSAMGATPNAGNNYTTTLTIDAGAAPSLSYIPWPLYKSYFRYNQNAPYPAGLYGPPVQLNDTLFFEENQSVAQVIAISNPGTNTSVLTVRFPAGAQGNVITQTVVGKAIPVLGDMWSEGSDQPKGKGFLVGLDTHYLTIAKETTWITGDQMTDQLWFNQDSLGKGIDGIKPLLMEISDYDMYKKMSMTLLFGPGGGAAGGTTPYLDPTTNLEPNKMMEGTVNYIKRRGLDMTVAPGSLNLGHFATEEDIMIQRYGVGVRMIYCGHKRAREINTMLTTANAGTFIKYANEDKELFDKLYRNNQSLAMSLNYSSFMIGNRTKYVICSIPEFDVFDKYDDSLSWAAMIIPHGINPASSRRAQNREPLKHMNLIHKGMNGYNRFFETWKGTRGAGGDTKNYNSGLDQEQVNMRSEFGCEHNGGMKMTWLHK